MAEKGKLTVYFGPMFCGKTSTLIYAYKKLKAEGTKVICIKPAIDDRYGADEFLYSHGKLQAPAKLLNDTKKPEKILKMVSDEIELVIIDEVMFISDKVVGVVEELLSGGKDVIVGGLMGDSDGNDFGPMRQLSQKADHVAELFSVCDFVGCGMPASMSYAKKEKKVQLEVGADQYGACCSDHHTSLNKGGVDRKSVVDKHEDFLKMKIYPGYVEWFENLEFPLLRKKAKMGKTPNIEVGADSMRVGKTTAVEVIAGGFSEDGNGVVESYEDFVNNPYLKESYSDPREAILKSQQWFATRKYEQVSGAPEDKVYVQDVHPEMDFCYAVTNVLVGRMSLKQFEKYRKHYYGLDWEKVSQPDVLVYLKASDNVLLDRAKKSLREFEEIDENYFLVMKMVNRAWLKRARKVMNVVEIDTDKLDFSVDKKAKEELVQRVKQELGGNGVKKSKMQHESVYGSMDEVISELTKYRAVFLAGLPGSGKSYLARKLNRDYKYSLLTSDKFRKEISGEERYGLQGHEKNTSYSVQAYERIYKKVGEVLGSEGLVVVDATNMKREFGDHVRSLRNGTNSKEMVVCLVKTGEDVIAHRMKKKKGMANKDETIFDGWERVYKYFMDSLESELFVWPDEKDLGIRVVEVWNG